MHFLRYKKTGKSSESTSNQTRRATKMTMLMALAMATGAHMESRASVVAKRARYVKTDVRVRGGVMVRGGNVWPRVSAGAKGFGGGGTNTGGVGRFPLPPQPTGVLLIRFMG